MVWIGYSQWLLMIVDSDSWSIWRVLRISGICDGEGSLVGGLRLSIRDKGNQGLE